MRKSRRAAALCGAAVLSAATAWAATGLESWIEAIGGEARPQQAMQWMREVYSTDRWFTFPKFQETSEFLFHTMQAIGLEQVEIIQAPADGKSQFGFWTMPLAWDVRSATLEIAGPDPVVLADYLKVPASLGMWSGPTPPEGVHAEVVELPSAANIAALNLKGKLVLTSRNPADIKWQLVKAGALGAINAFTENKDLPEGRQWINAWGDRGWAFTRNNAPLLCF